MAIRDLLNNYYYGKQGKGDFTLADLPKTRPELFFTVLKVRWGQLVGLNLLYLVFWLPAIAWTALNLAALNSAALSGQEGLSGIVATWLLLLAPCIAVTGPFNAGITYVLRNWARDEHSFVWSDFWQAVRNNWKQALAVSCISGAMPVLLYVSVTFYGGRVRAMPVFIVPIALVILVALLWFLAEMLMMPMLVTYELRLRDIIRNSVLLTLGKLPFAVLFRLITLVLPALALTVMALAPQAQVYALLILSGLYLLIVPAFNKLVTASYANWLCETYLNPRIEGARTNIGLRPENWDDVEYRPEDDEE